MLATPAIGQTPQRLIPDFGAFNPIADAFEEPDPLVRYRIIFDVSQAARAEGSVHQGLDRVARMVNLLNYYGVKLQPGDIVVTLHGAAAKTALTPAAYAKRFKNEATPNAALIQQLTEAGVSVRLCGQSMVANGFEKEELNSDIKVDVSAITTIGTLQMRGYALIQD
ncbi:DsrE family protein [Sphingobium sp. MK2]|uniref:DsrE family protein n=1 Tax=Sphingobium sp. MK2 TaxID=3116540 RepID=UPI0032E36828